MSMTDEQINGREGIIRRSLDDRNQRGYISASAVVDDLRFLIAVLDAERLLITQLKHELQMERGLCRTCDGTGKVDGSGMSPRGKALKVPCPTCHVQEREELITIGAAWRENSSLEEWFPYTAERLRELELKNKQPEPPRPH